MKKYRYKNKDKSSRKEKIGFFTAFSVCIIAIALGLWSTYASIGGLNGNVTQETEPTYTAALNNVTEAVDNNVQGIIVEDSDGEEADVEEAQDHTEEFKEATEDSQMPTQAMSFISGEEDKLQTILQVTSSLIYPVSGERVTKEYSEQAVYSETMKDYRPHTGTDFKASPGEAVFSVCEGIVDDIAVDDMYGNTVKITNGIYSVYYFGLGEEIVVSEGDAVETGEVIAQVGEVPCESEDEPHLHMEVRVNGNSIDPITVISNDR